MYIHSVSNIIKGFMNFLTLSQGRMKQREEPRFIASDRFAFDSCGSSLPIAWTWAWFVYFKVVCVCNQLYDNNNNNPYNTVLLEKLRA